MVYSFSSYLSSWASFSLSFSQRLRSFIDFSNWNVFICLHPTSISQWFYMLFRGLPPSMRCCSIDRLCTFDTIMKNFWYLLLFNKVHTVKINNYQWIVFKNVGYIKIISNPHLAIWFDVPSPIDQLLSLHRVECIDLFHPICRQPITLHTFVHLANHKFQTHAFCHSRIHRRTSCHHSNSRFLFHAYCYLSTLLHTCVHLSIRIYHSHLFCCLPIILHKYFDQAIGICLILAFFLQYIILHILNHLAKSQFHTHLKDHSSNSPHI